VPSTQSLSNRSLASDPPRKFRDQMSLSDNIIQKGLAFPKHPVVCFDESPTQLILTEYNEARPHQGRWCFGKTPMQTFPDAMPMTKEKMIAA